MTAPGRTTTPVPVERSPWARLGGGLVLLTAMALVLWWSGRALPGPTTVDAPGLERWFSGDPIVAAFALVRLVGLVLIGWAAITGALGLVVHRSRRLREVPHLRSVVDRLCFPMVRRLVHGVAGATMAAVVFTPTLAGATPAPDAARVEAEAVAASTPGGIATMVVIDAPGPPSLATSPGPHGDPSPSGPDGPDAPGGPTAGPATGEVAVMVSAAARPRPASPAAAPAPTPTAPASMDAAEPAALAPATEAPAIPASTPAATPGSVDAERSTGTDVPAPRTWSSRPPADPPGSAPASASANGVPRPATRPSPPPGAPAVDLRAVIVDLEAPPTAVLVDLGSTTPTTATADPAPVLPSPAGVDVADERWVIERGQHLWHVAETTLARRWGAPAGEREVAAYLAVLIDANRDRLVVPSDPDLVFAGQELVLPPG